MANATTIEAQTVLGVPYTVATFTLENKYKVSGYIDSQNMIHKVETWVDNPVFGDLKVEALLHGLSGLHRREVPHDDHQ